MASCSVPGGEGEEEGTRQKNVANVMGIRAGLHRRLEGHSIRMVLLARTSMLIEGTRKLEGESTTLIGWKDANAD